jgi:hypothetical protein
MAPKFHVRTDMNSICFTQYRSCCDCSCVSMPSAAICLTGSWSVSKVCFSFYSPASKAKTVSLVYLFFVIPNLGIKPSIHCYWYFESSVQAGTCYNPYVLLYLVISSFSPDTWTASRSQLVEREQSRSGSAFCLTYASKLPNSSKMIYS